METDNTNRHHLARAIGFVIRSVFTACFLFGASPAFAQPATKLTPEDYDQIYNLYAEYAYALDTGNGAARTATFTPDGTFSWMLTHHKPETMDSVKARTDKYPHFDRPGLGRHMMLNIHITPTTQGADGFCYALFPDPGSAPDAMGGIKVILGFYKDTLVKTAAGWRFKTREVWIGPKEMPTPIKP
jgi:hypothetical protein